MQTNHNYQDTFLTQAQRRRAPVTVYLVNGFQMRGVVAAFDSFVVLLEVPFFALNYFILVDILINLKVDIFSLLFYYIKLILYCILQINSILK